MLHLLLHLLLLLQFQKPTPLKAYPTNAHAVPSPRRSSDVSANVIPYPLPESAEAERAVLGSIILDNRSYYDLPSGFTADLFHRPQNRALFEAMTELMDFDQPVDYLTLVEHLKATGRDVETIYVVSLADAVPSASRMEHYAGIVVARGVRRKLLHALTRATADARDLEKPVEDIQSALEHALVDASSGFGRKRTTSAEAAAAMLAQAQQARTTGAVRGALTGLPSLDKVLWINPSDLVLVGARPGNGKSILLYQIARHIGRTKPVLFINLEMADTELLQRGATSGGLDLEQVREPIHDAVWERLQDLAAELGQSQVEFLPERDPLAMLREASRMHRRSTGGLGALIIDYVQIVGLNSSHGANRDQQIGWFTSRLKRWADEHQCPVIAASQIRRLDTVLKGKSAEPELEDLRESGNLEQDSNSVLLLHVPGTIRGTHEQRKNDFRTTVLKVAKNRHGRARERVNLRAQFEHARFVDPKAPTDESEEAEV